MCLLQLRLVAQIQDIWNKLQSMHGELTHHLSEATVNPETMDKNLELAIDVQLIAFNLSKVFMVLCHCNHMNLITYMRNQRDAIQATYCKITKLDVAMNGMLQRVKQLDQTYRTLAPKNPVSCSHVP